MENVNQFLTAPDFELLIRHIADSQEFAPPKDKLSKLVSKYSGWLGSELSVNELDQVAAAAKIPVPEFKHKKV